MSVTTIGIIGIIVLVFMLFSKMPVGFVMGFLGFLGFAYVVNLDAALGLLARDFFEIFSSYSLTVVPLFVLMAVCPHGAGGLSLRH
jgi:TRAP-type mannitol/chloroaromatic compound transport system permease large subunit